MTVLDDPPATPSPPAGPRAARLVTPVRALALLVALSALAATFFGVRWALALGDDGLELARERDVVLVDAQQAALNLNSLDFAHVDAGLDLWEQSSTGPLLDEFRANRAEYAKVVTDSKRVTTATVTDAAVAEVDVRAGTARVLVGVDVQVRPEGQDPVGTRQRLQLEMTRTDAGWKASRLAPVRAPSS
jgi:Mce-associated membrane protein